MDNPITKISCYLILGRSSCGQSDTSTENLRFTLGEQRAELCLVWGNFGKEVSRNENMWKGGLALKKFL
jgi:hypothetical protein